MFRNSFHWPVNSIFLFHSLFKSKFWLSIPMSYCSLLFFELLLSIWPDLMDSSICFWAPYNICSKIWYLIFLSKFYSSTALPFAVVNCLLSLLPGAFLALFSHFFSLNVLRKHPGQRWSLLKHQKQKIPLLLSKTS